jgi:hypothetical protein
MKTMALLKLYNLIILLTSKITYSHGIHTFKIGVPLVASAGTPYDIERVGPAIDIAVKKVNKEILNGSYQLEIIEKPYGSFCSGSRAPGKILSCLLMHNICCSNTDSLMTKLLFYNDLIRPEWLTERLRLLTNSPGKKENPFLQHTHIMIHF